MGRLNITRVCELRSDMTLAEAAFLQHLRRRQVNGHKFRRQPLVSLFLVDFACLETSSSLNWTAANMPDRCPMIRFVASG